MKEDIWAITIHGRLYEVCKLQDAWNLAEQLAKVYTVDTDQAELIRLVNEAKRLVNK